MTNTSLFCKLYMGEEVKLGSREIGNGGKGPPKERPGRAGGKRDQNRRRRIEDLLSSGLSLFLEKGIDAVTIDEIARRAEMAKGSFYRYFDDKAHLVAAIFEPLASETRDSLERCARTLESAEGEAELRAAYLALATELSSATLGRRDVTRLYLQEHRGTPTAARASIVDLERDLRSAAFRLSDTAVRRGLLQARVPHVTALVVIGAIEALAHEFLSGRLDSPPAQIAAQLVDLVLHGLRPNEALESAS